MTQAKKLRGLMPQRIDAREVRRVLERTEFDNKEPVYDDVQIIVEEGHLALNVDSRCIPRRHLALTD